MGVVWYIPPVLTNEYSGRFVSVFVMLADGDPSVLKEMEIHMVVIFSNARLLDLWKKCNIQSHRKCTKDSKLVTFKCFKYKVKEIIFNKTDQVDDFDDDNEGNEDGRDEDNDEVPNDADDESDYDEDAVRDDEDEL